MHVIRSINEVCRKCGAAADDYCKHSNVTKPKTASYDRFALSEYSTKAISEWIRMQNDEPSETPTDGPEETKGN